MGHDGLYGIHCVMVWSVLALFVFFMEALNL